MYVELLMLCFVEFLVAFIGGLSLILIYWLHGGDDNV